MKDEYVSLIPARDPTNNAIKWTMIHGSSIGQGKDYPNITLSKGGGNYKITYTIFDVNNLGIKFDPTPTDESSNPEGINAIWISEGEGSPKVKGDYPRQITQVKLPSATQLVVTDKNTDDVVLTYQLNFLDSANQPVTAIDPEIRNGGSGFTEYFDAGTLAMLLGAGILALTALLWFTNVRIAKKVQNLQPGPKAP